MKSILLFLTGITLLSADVSAQIQLNPQLGLNFTQLSVEPRDGFETEGKGGLLIGADLRIGDRFYLQPGAFITGSKTVYRFNDSLFVNASEVTAYGAKIKGLLGYKIIDSSLKLRVMAGPTYSFKLSRDAEENPYFDEEEFNNGSFNIDAGVGIDILFLTAELGYSWGLSDVFKKDVFENKPRYQTIYFTVGIVFGG